MGYCKSSDEPLLRHSRGTVLSFSQNAQAESEAQRARTNVSQHVTFSHSPTRAPQRPRTRDAAATSAASLCKRKRVECSSDSDEIHRSAKELHTPEDRDSSPEQPRRPETPQQHMAEAPHRAHKLPRVASPAHWHSCNLFNRSERVGHSPVPPRSASRRPTAGSHSRSAMRDHEQKAVALRDDLLQSYATRYKCGACALAHMHTKRGRRASGCPCRACWRHRFHACCLARLRPVHQFATALRSQGW